MKNDPFFHEHGFAPVNKKSNKWREDINHIKIFVNFAQPGTLVTSLEQLGLEYYRTKGKDSDLTKYILDEINLNLDWLPPEDCLKSEIINKEGFRGIRWGEHRASVGKFINKQDEGDGITSAVLYGEWLRFYGIKLKSIVYYFYNDRFSDVILHADNESSCQELQQVVVDNLNLLPIETGYQKKDSYTLADFKIKGKDCYIHFVSVSYLNNQF
jgi:hypothetical protein